MLLQWKPSVAATLGEQCFDRYIGVAFVEGLIIGYFPRKFPIKHFIVFDGRGPVHLAASFCTQTVHLGPGRCIAVVLYSWVAVKRGSTVPLEQIPTP